MRKVALLGAILLAGLGGTAQAHGFPAGTALLRASARVVAADPAVCPTGVPVQAITVINQAGVRPFALAKVENAVVDQSMQLRAAWGTPCVQFGAGGWPLYLRDEGISAHYTDPLQIEVSTGGYTYQAWSSTFSHELMETLVDPTTVSDYGTGPTGGNIEVADPVEHNAYRLGGTWISDFVLPSWYAGAHIGVCATIAMYPPTYDCPGPMLAAADASGPYDEMGILAAPWQTDQGSM